MFQVDEDVFCPLYGIIKINTIEERDVTGKVENFYVFHVKGSKIMIPVERSSDLGFRKTKTEKEIDDFMNYLKNSVILNSSNSWMERYAPYLEPMKKGDPFVLGDVIKDLYWQNKENIFSGKEKEIWSRLYHNLIEEIAYVKKLTKTNTNKFISKILWESK